jgi:two-component sensor histidine kinase
LLLKEMRHRVKNLFAVAAGIVALSARSVRTPEEMAMAVRKRLMALSRAHDLTRPDLAENSALMDRTTTLRELILAILAPYGDPDDPTSAACVVCSGPDVAVGGAAVTGLALVLHEFATNAAKYGALSASTGRVEIEWSVSAETLQLTWREKDGPAVENSPANHGFGSTLARQTVTATLSGELTYAWNAEGLSIRLAVPVNRLTS